MAEPRVAQFVFYGDGDSRNFPAEIDLWLHENSSGKTLLSNYGPVIKLGIQALPGTRFFLGSNLAQGLLVDHSGIYELDLKNLTTTISQLTFDTASLTRISAADNAAIIVDILYNPMADKVVS